MLPKAAELLTPIKESMPVLITQGAADTAVPVDYTRRWAATMKDLNMNSLYIEVGREDHGTIIATTMPDIFRYFSEHTKTATH